MRIVRVLLVALALTATAVCVGGMTQDPTPLSEVEQLRVQNLNLERIIIERSVKDWQEKQQRLKVDVEKARPGFTWDPVTGQFAKAK